MSEDAAGQCLVLLCRPGFEKECSAEILALLQHHAMDCFCRTESNSGVVVVQSASDWNPGASFAALRFRDLIFVRDWFSARRFDGLAVGDRISPLIAMAQPLGPFSACWLQHLDTEDGRSVGRLGTRLRGRMEGALRADSLLCDSAAQRLHILFVSGTGGYIGVSPAANGASWSMGIPRLRLAGAPSRSASKLEEAFLWFLGAESAAYLCAGMSAVDLGAAPGGWTWQLVRRELSVTAVDHGALRSDLLDSGLVQHLREDAFRFRPGQPVDWMVCDIVDKPARVADLLQRWFAEGWCTRSIFNLKLPMKTRYRESMMLLARIREQLAAADVRVAMEARQLYHDREEITVYMHAARPSSRSRLQSDAESLRR